MNRLFVDTSFWVALYRRRDDLHPRAASLWTRVTANALRLTTSDYVVDEVATLLAARSRHEASVRAVQAIVSSPRVSLVPVGGPYFTATVSAWESFREGYSFTDVSSFVIMRALKLDAVLSFDADFARAGFTLFV